MSAQSSRGKKGTRAPYFAIPNSVTLHPDFATLSGSAVKLLVAVGSAFKGKNNGDLSCSMTLMKRYGFKSNATLTRATKELVNKGFLIQTRVGGLNAGPHLYALAWHCIDECKGKLDTSPTNRPPRDFNDHTKIFASKKTGADNTK
jgi:hypothetical protein